MPWRVKGGAHPDAYKVWISEIMLQQTTVQSVIPYFDRWLKRFPDLKTLAEADIEDVLLLWQGLGYYTRARNIHKCAGVFQKMGGIPQDKNTLIKCPGIGPYSAASICAFAFNQPEVVIDGNVIRVLTRLKGITEPATREVVFDSAKALTPPEHGADYASAIMDLGATICKPTEPLCPQCPWQKACIAYRDKLTEVIPNIKKPAKENRTGYVYVVHNEKGELYIQKRTKKGLLAGLYELPWAYDKTPPFKVPWQDTGQVVKHTFTHFHLELKVLSYQGETPALPGLFVAKKDLKNYPFSTLMKKVLKSVS